MSVCVGCGWTRNLVKVERRWWTEEAQPKTKDQESSILAMVESGRCDQETDIFISQDNGKENCSGSQARGMGRSAGKHRRRENQPQNREAEIYQQEGCVVSVMRGITDKKPGLILFYSVCMCVCVRSCVRACTRACV